ncbi:MAG: ATP-binding protein [Thermoguttaceae bacterium]
MTPTQRKTGNDRFEAYLDRWREKAEQSDHYELAYELTGISCWQDGVDYGLLLRNKAMGDLLRDIGPRYRQATLESFVVTDPRQQREVALVRGYLDAIDNREAAGEGLIFYGPCGTGKDHLAVAAGKTAIGLGHSVAWRSAQTIFSDFRDSFSDESGQSEADLMRNLTQPDILIVSDPVPSHGELTDFQGNILYRLVNARYCETKPTWVTLNVANVEDARRRVGSATIDRLTHGATVVFCNWPSYRRAGA